MNGTWRIVGFVAMTAMLMGCASTQRLPEWVGNPAVLRDSASYFVAVADGTTLDEAEQQATSLVLAQIREATAHQEVDTAEYQRRLLQAGRQPEVTIELLELSDLDAARTMVGLEIVQRHVDEKAQRTYAMASVSRAQLVSTYETEMRLNAALANRMATQADGEDVTLRRFSMLRTALVSAEAYNALRVARGRLAGPLTGYDPTLDPPDASMHELRERIATLRSEVAASIEARGPEEVPIVIETELKSALQRLNVPVRTDVSEGHVRIFVTYAVLPVNETAPDARLVNWRLNVEVVEDASGRSMATLALDGKTGSVTLQDAKAEATRLARIDLREKIDGFLNETLFEQALNQ